LSSIFAKLHRPGNKWIIAPSNTHLSFFKTSEYRCRLIPHPALLNKALELKFDEMSVRADKNTPINFSCKCTYDCMIYASSTLQNLYYERFQVFLFENFFKIIPRLKKSKNSFHINISNFKNTTQPPNPPAPRISEIDHRPLVLRSLALFSLEFQILCTTTRYYNSVYSTLKIPGIAYLDD
jgi:hypothetical protein